VLKAFILPDDLVVAGFSLLIGRYLPTVLCQTFYIGVSVQQFVLIYCNTKARNSQFSVKMVEVAGIEPASKEQRHKESTCLVVFKSRTLWQRQSDPKRSSRKS